MSTIAVPIQSLRTAVVRLAEVEVRDPSGTGDGSWSLTGYAAVFEQETVLFDAYGLRVKEELAAGAFTRVLERLATGDGLVHLNHGHDMKSAIASTNVARGVGDNEPVPVGGLKLSQDGHGLHFNARVDPSDPDAVRLAAKMRRGVVDQASFAFTIENERIVDERELDDGTVEVKWRVEEVRDLFDVCACAQGAYPTTESHLRSMTAASLRVAVLELPALASTDADGPGRRTFGSGPNQVADTSSEESGRVADQRKRIELKARAAAATTTK